MYITWFTVQDSGLYVCICMCLVNEQMHCGAGAKKARRQPSVLLQNLYLCTYISLSHWNVLLPNTLYKSVAGKNRPTFDPICRSVSCALLVLYVWYLKSPSSDLALREQKKSEESEQTAQSEKRPNAITLSLVWAISSKSFFVTEKKFKRGKFSEELHYKPNASQALWSQTLVEWMILKSTNLGKLLAPKFWKQNEEEDCTGNAWDMTSTINGRKDLQCLNIASKSNGEASSKTIWHTIPFMQTWYFRDFLSATVWLLKLPHCSKSWTLAATEGQATKNSTMQLLDWCRNETYQSSNKREITWRE